MKTPKAVLEAASWLTEQFDGHLEHLGTYEGKEAFVFNPNEPLIIGFPNVFLYDEEGSVEEVKGFESLDVISFFAPLEDVEE